MRLVSIALLLAAAVQDQDDSSVRLRYDGKRGQEREVLLKTQFGIGFEGDPDSIDLLRSLSPFFAFERATIEGPAVQKILHARRDEPLEHWIRFNRAVAEGVYDEEPFEYTFEKGKEYDDLETDALKGMLFAIFQGGRRFRLSRRGEFREMLDENKDPNGEALDHITTPYPRFPEEAVGVGDSWTVSWASRTTDKETGGRIEFAQTCTLKSLEEGTARIEVVLEGKDDREGKGKNGNTNEVRVRGSATVRFDVEAGRLISYEGEGEVRIHVAGEDPNQGLEYDATIILKGEGNLGPRE